MDENEKTVRKIYSLPSRIVSRDKDGETVSTTTYTPRVDGNCELLCVRNDGMQAWFVCDTRGNVTERVDRKADGSISHHFKRKFDEKGNFTGELCFDGEGRITKRFEYRFDANGNETERLHYEAEQLQSRLVYENNAEGKLCRMTEYGADGSAKKRVDWEYDKRGRETKRAEFDSAGHAKEVVCFAYGENEDGSRWSECTVYGANGEIENRTLEEFDADDRLTKATFFRTDGSVLEAYEHRYAADGELSESLDFDGNGRIQARFIYERDENGKTEKVTTYGVDGYFETAVSAYEEGKREKVFRLTAKTVYGPDGNMIQQSKITDTCAVTLTEAQYETFRWFSGVMV